MRLPPRAAPTVPFHVRPLAFLTEVHERYGDVAVTDLDGTPTVWCGGASGAAELFRAERGGLEVHNTALVHELFGEAVFNLRGEQHLRARAVLQAGLGRRRLAGYLPHLVRLCRAHVASLPDRFDLYQQARALTMAACVRTVLGIPPDGGPAARVSAAFDVFVRGTHVPSGTRHDRPEYHAARAAGDELRELFRRRISAARRAPGEDYLSWTVRTLDPASAEARRLPDHLLAVLVAMRETTASLILWFLLELARGRGVPPSVVPEATAFLADPPSLLDRGCGPGLRAALLETERLHSPNAVSLRTVVRDCRIGGYDVPRGWHAAYSPSADHLSPRRYPRPDRYCPARFTGAAPASGPAAPGPLLTFGGGLHACPGKHLAELIALTTAAAVVAEHRLVPLGGFPTELAYLPVKAPLHAVPVRLGPAATGSEGAR